MVGDREFDLAALVPQGGGAATQELETAPGGREFNEAVVLGTPEGVYRFTVARAERRPADGRGQAAGAARRGHAHARGGHHAARRGDRRRRQAEPAFLFARRRGDAMEVVVRRAARGRPLHRAPRPRRARAARQAARRVEPAARGRAPLATGSAPTSTASPTAARRPSTRPRVIGERRLRPYYTVENNVSVRSERGGRGRRPRRAAEEDAKPRLARRAARRRPRCSCTGSRCGSRGAPRAGGRRSPTAATSASCCCTRGGWAARCARR